MLRLDASRDVSFCDRLTRRDFLHAGAISTLGLTLPGFLAARASGAAPDKDMNCIMLFLLGGPSHIDTWDPKPDAPAEVRGPFSPIATSVPGIRITEIFPKLAQQADKLLADPQRLPHGHGRPRHRPPDDADRPAVQRRQSSIRTPAASWAT